MVIIIIIIIFIIIIIIIIISSSSSSSSSSSIISLDYDNVSGYDTARGFLGGVGLGVSPFPWLFF